MSRDCYWGARVNYADSRGTAEAVNFNKFVTPMIDTTAAVTPNRIVKQTNLKCREGNNDILNDLGPERQVERNNKSQGFCGNTD